MNVSTLNLNSLYNVSVDKAKYSIDISHDFSFALLGDETGIYLLQGGKKNKYFNIN
jgi:hypothetical protein